MSRLPDVSGAELVMALRKAGFAVLRQKVQSRLTGEDGCRWPLANGYPDASRDCARTGLTREELSKLL